MANRKCDSISGDLQHDFTTARGFTALVLSQRSACSLFAKKFLAAVALFGSLALVGSGCGIDRNHAEPMTATATTEPSPAGQKYELHLRHLHTGETLDVVYKVGNEYVPQAIDELNHFLRDHRTETESHYDPKEFDTLHAVLEKLHRPNATIDIVCGYRTPWSNSFLRMRGGKASLRTTGVAEHSQHMLAKAIDIRIPGVSTRTLRDAALSLHAGGVGYYPTSQFVHVDVGPVRQWSFGGRHSREG